MAGPLARTRSPARAAPAPVNAMWSRGIRPAAWCASPAAGCPEAPSPPRRAREGLSWKRSYRWQPVGCPPAGSLRRSYPRCPPRRPCRSSSPYRGPCAPEWCPCQGPPGMTSATRQPRSAAAPQPEPGTALLRQCEGTCALELTPAAPKTPGSVSPYSATGAHTAAGRRASRVWVPELPAMRAQLHPACSRGTVSERRPADIAATSRRREAKAPPRAPAQQRLACWRGVDAGGVGTRRWARKRTETTAEVSRAGAGERAVAEEVCVRPGFLFGQASGGVADTAHSRRCSMEGPLAMGACLRSAADDRGRRERDSRERRRGATVPLTAGDGARSSGRCARLG